MGAVRGALAALASRSKDRKASTPISSRASAPRSAASPRSSAPARPAASRSAGSSRASAAHASAARGSGQRPGGGPRGGAGRGTARGGGGPRDPRGPRGARAPQPPAQPRYWLRRLILLGAVVLLLLAVVLGIVKGAYAIRDQIREQDRQQAAEQTVTPYPAPQACAADALGVSVSAPEEVASGAGMSIEVSVTNNGADACLLDLGSQSLGASITSGGNPVWASDTCSPSADSRQLLVKPGASSSATITWDGRRSGTECAPAAPTATATGQAASATPSESPSATPTESPSADPSASSSADPSASTDPSATPTPSLSPLAPAQSNGDVATTGVYKLQLRLGDASLGDEKVFVVK